MARPSRRSARRLPAVPGRVLFEVTAQNAVAWLAANRQWFEPDNVTLPGRRDKPVVELTLLVRALRDAESEYAGLEELAALVREVGARPDRRHAPRPTRGQLLAGAFLFAAAYRAPGEDPTEHRRLQRLVDVRLLDTLEQPAHRVMEDRLALDWAGLRHSLPSWQVLADGSILGAKPNPAFMDEVAAYQFTHVVMYLTALGSRPPRPAWRPTSGVGSSSRRSSSASSEIGTGTSWGNCCCRGPSSSSDQARCAMGHGRPFCRRWTLTAPLLSRGAWATRAWTRARRVISGPLPPDPGDRSRRGCMAEGLRTATSSVQRSRANGRAVRPARDG